MNLKIATHNRNVIRDRGRVSAMDWGRTRQAFNAFEQVSSAPSPALTEPPPPRDCLLSHCNSLAAPPSSIRAGQQSRHIFLWTHSLRQRLCASRPARGRSSLWLGNIFSDFAGYVLCKTALTRALRRIACLGHAAIFTAFPDPLLGQPDCTRLDVRQLRNRSDWQISVSDGTQAAKHASRPQTPGQRLEDRVTR